MFLLIIYRIFTFLVLPFIFLFLYLSNTHKKEYLKRILEHLSIFKLSFNHKQSIVITASSLGEVLIVIDLLDDLKKLPFNIIIVTNDFESFQKLKPFLIDNVYHLFLPLDNYFIIKNFIKKTNPQLFITVEREFFPEMLISMKKNGTKLLLINGRLSDNSANIYLKIKPILIYLYTLYDKILVQYELDFKNYAKFYNKNNILLTGNLKFNRKLNDIHPLFENKTSKKVICFGSIREGEEKIILRTCKIILQKIDCIFILAPRYLKQISTLTEKLENYQLVSSIQKDITSNYLILDSMGNLVNAYANADIVFIGGSLTKKYGGHNVLEPILLNKPTIIGNNYRNFQVIVDELVAENGILVCNENTLITTVVNLLENTTNQNNLINNSLIVINKYMNSKKYTLEVIYYSLNN